MPILNEYVLLSSCYSTIFAGLAIQTFSLSFKLFNWWQEIANILMALVAGKVYLQLVTTLKSGVKGQSNKFINIYIYIATYLTTLYK